MPKTNTKTSQIKLYQGDANFRGYGSCKIVNYYHRLGLNDGKEITCFEANTQDSEFTTGPFIQQPVSMVGDFVVQNKTLRNAWNIFTVIIPDGACIRVHYKIKSSGVGSGYKMIDIMLRARADAAYTDLKIDFVQHPHALYKQSSIEGNFDIIHPDNFDVFRITHDAETIHRFDPENWGGLVEAVIVQKAKTPLHIPEYIEHNVRGGRRIQLPKRHSKQRALGFSNRSRK